MNPMIAGLTPSALARNSGRILTVTSLLKSVSIDTKPKTKTFWLSPKNLRCGLSCRISTGAFTLPAFSTQYLSCDTCNCRYSISIVTRRQEGGTMLWARQLESDNKVQEFPLMCWNFSPNSGLHQRLPKPAV